MTALTDADIMAMATRLSKAIKDGGRIFFRLPGGMRVEVTLDEAAQMFNRLHAASMNLNEED